MALETTIKVSTALLKQLQTSKNRDESYNDYLLKLLGVSQ